LAKVIRLKPEDAQAHYQLATVYLLKKADGLRRQELSEALRLNPSLLRARVELADSLLSAHAPKVALDLMNGVPPDQSKLLPVVLMRNWSLLSEGNYTEARKGITEALSRSRTPESVLQEGVLRMNQRDFSGARTDLEEVFKSTPEDMRAIQALANSYFLEKKDKAGIDRVRTLAAAQPASAALQAYLGQLLLLAGDRAGARAAFEATKKINPSYDPADVGLAMLDSSEGKLDSARRILLPLTTRKDPNSLAALRLGMIEEAAHDYPAAIGAYKKAADARVTDWVPLNNLANCLIVVGQYDEALKYAQQAKELAPTSPFVADTIGWAFYNKGMYGAAVKQLQEFKNDQMPLRRYHLAMAYFKSGDLASGRTTLDTALKMEPANPEAVEAQKVAEEASRKR
jgi:tetratricopeptide (TPR) repeat protein